CSCSPLFPYTTLFRSTAGAEHELCSVFIGRCTERLRIDPNEILAWRWISPRALQAEVTGTGAGNFTPWFILEWGRIWRDHRAARSEEHTSELQSPDHL